MATTYPFYVLHSPYPDKSWRGIEKCVTIGSTGMVMLFDTKQEAEEYMKKFNLEEFVPVELELITPDVRGRCEFGE